MLINKEILKIIDYHYNRKMILVLINQRLIKSKVSSKINQMNKVKLRNIFKRFFKNNLKLVQKKTIIAI